MRRALVVPAVLCGVLGLATLTACGGEPPVPDDGGQAALNLSLLPESVEVLSPTAPQAATAQQAASALTSLEAAPVTSTDREGLQVEAVASAGLLGLVAPPGRRPAFAVLVYDDPASALVGTSAVASAFGAGSALVPRLFSGNLVAYYADAVTARERRVIADALDLLAASPHAPSASASPKETS
ncbi:hypothetical protein [Nocardioides sp. R-C-SC26]|uniref:hypothetical protein n=1 Tax=Nocardioides sp. R-C-SC26 TaxID=2870414 RepID=UPI001E65C73F|nr:hypothetical protein [Nocardioides sp. R-C-SC26]